MAGREVLNPMGWDAFGLPAENAAIQSGVPPREYTLGNIARMKEQLNAPRAASTTGRRSSPPAIRAYYRWNQWLFLRMWERGLAYRKTAPVNWCPGCRTVLANEQVVDGRCERSGDAVEIRDLTQWFFRITDYAERLLEGLDNLPTGRTASRRCSATGSAAPRAPRSCSRSTVSSEPVTVFTTRPDTLHGATFLALAPEHPAVALLAKGSGKARGDRAVRRARAARVAPRAGSRGRREGGVGRRAPSRSTRRNGEKIPVWLANFVLPEYGTGAIMGVPAHDQRDFEFARQVRPSDSPGLSDGGGRDRPRPR